MLANIQRPVLVARKGRTFDFVFLYKAAQSCNMLPRLQNSVHLFLDTLPMCRVILPWLYGCYKLTYVYKRLSKKSFPTHDAMQDTLALQEITLDLARRAVDMDEFYHYSFGINKVLYKAHPPANYSPPTSISDDTM